MFEGAFVGGPDGEDVVGGGELGDPVVLGGVCEDERAAAEEAEARGRGEGEGGRDRAGLVRSLCQQ